MTMSIDAGQTFDEIYSCSLLIVHPPYLQSSKEEFIESVFAIDCAEAHNCARWLAEVARPYELNFATRLDGSSLGVAFADFASHGDAVCHHFQTFLLIRFSFAFGASALVWVSRALGCASASSTLPRCLIAVAVCH